MRTQKLVLSVGIVTLTLLLTTSLEAQTIVIVDDSFADGDLAKTGALDTAWWTSSSTSGIEISPGSLGLVTGTSGRGIHTTFPTQTLSNIGDSLKATYTFTTPATVGGGSSSALRVGLFDNLGRLTANNPGVDPNDNRNDLCCLDANVNASSSDPNAVFGWGIAEGGPGSQPLPGYMFDMDVNTDATADLNFREHTQLPVTLVGTGRLMSTTSNFDNISPSGPDEGYTFDPNTEYTGSFQITRISATEFELTGTLGSISYTNTDEFDSDSFGFLGFHTNSNQFGSSNSAGEPDNGLDFSNIKIEFTPIPEPSTIALLLGACLAIPYKARRRR